MGFEGKKLNQWVRNSKVYFINLWKKIESKKRLLFQVISILTLFAASLIVYVVISNQNRYPKTTGTGLFSKNLNHAINEYRLENYEKAKIILNNIIDSSKNKSEIAIAFIYLGNIEYKTGNFKKALEYYTEAAKKHKRYKKYALYNSSIIYMKIGDLKDAIRVLKEIIGKKEKFVEANLLLGNLYFLENKYDKAGVLYREFYDEPVMKFNYAMTELNEGRLKEAERLFFEIAKNEKINPVIRGLSYFKIGSLKEKEDVLQSANYYKEALKYFSQDENLYFNTALQFARANDFREAYSLITGWTGDIDSDMGQLFYGILAYYAGDFKESFSILKGLKGLKGKNGALVCTVLGDISAKWGNYKDAEEWYLKAQRLYRFVPAYIRLIRLYKIEGKKKEIVRFCKSLTFSKKDDVPLMVECSKVYFKNGNQPDGLKVLKDAIKLSENDEELLYVIADVYANFGFSNNALRLLYSILDNNPENWKAKFLIATIFKNLDQKDRALKILDSIVKNCSDLEIYYDAMFTRAELSSMDKAVYIYNKLIDDFPYRYESYFNLSRILLLKNDYYGSIKTVDKLLRLNLSIPDKILAGLYTLKAIALYYAGKDEESGKFFNLAIKIDEDYEPSRVNIKLLKSINH